MAFSEYVNFSNILCSSLSEPSNSEEVRIKSPLTTPLLMVTSYNYIAYYLPFLLNFYPSFQIGFVSCMSTYARDSATFFFLPRSNSTHYHKRDLPLITQTNVGLLSLHFQLRRKAKSWLKMLSLLDILPTAGFEFQVISFTWPGSTELEVQTNASWFCSFTYSCNKIIMTQIQISPKIEMAFSQILAIRWWFN